jgi:hypothetical protein
VLNELLRNWMALTKTMSAVIGATTCGKSRHGPYCGCPRFAGQAMRERPTTLAGKEI